MALNFFLPQFNDVIVSLIFVLFYQFRLKKTYYMYIITGINNCSQEMYKQVDYIGGFCNYIK